MIRFLWSALLSALMLLSPTFAFAQTSSILSVQVVPPQVAGFVYPQITAVSPNLVIVPIPAAAGTIVATPAIVNSDGSAFAGTLSVSGDSLFTTSGMNVVLARATTAPADQNVPHKVMVTATEPGTNGASVSVQLQPRAGTISCDIGPPVDADEVPQPAAAANFTHCAMNIDFAQPLYQKQMNWFNPNFFSAKGVDTNKIWYYTHLS